MVVLEGRAVVVVAVVVVVVVVASVAVVVAAAVMMVVPGWALLLRHEGVVIRAHETGNTPAIHKAADSLKQF